MALKVDRNTKRASDEKRHYFAWEDFPSAAEAQRTEPTCGQINPVSLARQWQASMEERGEPTSDLAWRLGVSRARVTEVLQVLDLDPDALDLLELQTGLKMVPERP